MQKKSENHGTLKFKQGKFVLTGIDSKTRMRLLKDSHWESLGNDSYSTSDIGAAAKFRGVASENVEKIFIKTFQEHYEFPAFELPRELDDHQVQGIYWCLTRKRSYLAHAPGAGKTAQAILAAHFSKTSGSKGKGQTLFIVPPSLTKNWEREILKVTGWVDNFPTIGVVGRSEGRHSVAWRAEFIICPDSMLTRDWVAEKLREIPWKFIAVDEASRFKERTAKRSLAFYGGSDGDISFSNLFRNARHTVFLDGSPMPNRPMELFAPTFALHPEAIDCMSYDDFGYRYCGAKPNDRGVWEYLYSSNESELKERLQSDFMQVVTEESLEHPERLRSMVYLNHDVRSREHKEWERKNLGRVELSDTNSRGDLARFRRELGIRKTPYVAEYVAERLREKNESILLFAWHKDVIGHLQMELGKWKPLTITGGTPNKSREYAITEFQAGRTKLLIMNIAAAGRGNNLQRADRVIFGEWSWSDETNRQAEKRASRKGSSKQFVRCDYLVSPGSMDEVQLSSVFTKQNRVKRIIG